jgi:hypothetical protein
MGLHQDESLFACLGMFEHGFVKPPGEGIAFAGLRFIMLLTAGG